MKSFFKTPTIPDRIDRRIIAGVAIYGIVMIVIAFIAKGTGDEGDSILHYLYAKSAWQYKTHFFNHWAKPVYVLIAFPFAQFGLIGVKIMNILLNCGSIWFTYGIAKKLEFKFSWIPPIILASTPMYNHLSLSGLTEPMSACLFMAGIYFIIRNKFTYGVILLSFLPFVRSEGLIMLAPVFIYLIIISKYQYLPLLFAGHIFYSCTGYFFYKDFFWVFNKITYATLSSPYGSGDWFHFASKLPEITGTPLTFIFVIGVLWGTVLFIRYIKRQINQIEIPELVLIYATAVIFFLAHTSFWALGIFNSGGILRVMITIMPLMALISYRGIEYLFSFLSNSKIRQRLIYILTVVVFLYPFSGELYAYRWHRDFVPKADQYAQQELSGWLRNNYPEYHNNTFYYEAVYLSELLNIDWFDNSKRKRLLNSLKDNSFKSGDFIIWDDWFSIVEGQVDRKLFESDNRFEKLKTFSRINYWNGIRTTIIFRVK